MKGYDRFMIVVELAGNLKIARLTDREFRCLVLGVWPVAAKARPRGYLVVAGMPATEKDVAHQARLPVGVARSTLVRLRLLGMLELDEESGFEYCHDWHEINPDPAPSDTPEARRERKRRSRVGHEDVTRDRVVTSRVCHDPEVKRREVKASSASHSSSDADGADPASPEDERNCRLLAELATERNSKFKVKSRARWLADMRLLRERDGNTPDEIERAIRWVFADDFWGGVIQSPGNLREHFPQIWDRMKRNVVPMARRESPSDLLRAIDGGAA